MSKRVRNMIRRSSRHAEFDALWAERRKRELEERLAKMSPLDRAVHEVMLVSARRFHEAMSNATPDENCPQGVIYGIGGWKK